MLPSGGPVPPGPDSTSVSDIDDEDLAVADLAVVAGARGFRELVDHRLHDFSLHHRLDLQARPQRDVDGGAAVLLRVAALRAAAFDLCHRHTRNTPPVKHACHSL